MSKFESLEKKKSFVPGIYSDQLPKSESAYEIGLYDEVSGEGYYAEFSDTPVVVIGREYDDQKILRRLYYVDKQGKIFELEEFHAYSYEDETKIIERVIYKNGSGEIIAVYAFLETKEEYPSKSQFWEWRSGDGKKDWDPSVLEKSPVDVTGGVV